MRSHSALRKFSMRDHYIVTRPRPVSELDNNEPFFDMLDLRLHERSRRLQARRWRKLRHARLRA